MATKSLKQEWSYQHYDYIFGLNKKSNSKITLSIPVVNDHDPPNGETIRFLTHVFDEQKAAQLECIGKDGFYYQDKNHPEDSIAPITVLRKTEDNLYEGKINGVEIKLAFHRSSRNTHVLLTHKWPDKTTIARAFQKVDYV